MLQLVVLSLSLVGAKGGLPPLKAPAKAASSGKLGTIVVSTSTAGTKLFLDDKPAGSAPATLKNVVAGQHKVRLKRLGYLMAEETVVVEAGKTVELQMDLLPYAGILTVKVSQKGAQVFVDGKGVGVTPYEGEIAIGRRAVEVQKDGFQTYREVFQVGAGEPYKIDVTLQKGAVEANADVPLVAVIPKKKKADDPDAIPLAAPPSLTPRTTSGAPLQVSAGGQIIGPEGLEPWYKKWWVWTIAGAVVAGVSIGVGVGVGLSGPGGNQSAPAWPGAWALGGGQFGAGSR